MRTISVAVSDDDYEAFRRAAREQHRPIAQLIREAMSVFRQNHLEARTRLERVPVVHGMRMIGELPSRAELYDEIFGDDETG